jgi:hypothetical protein
MSRNDTLDERQIQAARLEAQGIVMREIAAEVGVARKTLYRWREIPAYSQFVALLISDTQRAARSVMRANAHSAAARIVQLLDSEDERIALSAAQTLLDRTGHVKAERVEVGGAIATASAVIVDPSEQLAALLAGGIKR